MSGEQRGGSVGQLDLGLHFILELCALAAFGYWGWSLTGEWWRYLLMLGVPAAGATVWGVFAVPGDPSRSDNAPIPVSGAVRLVLELGFFGLAGWALSTVGVLASGLVLGAVVVAHYGRSMDRLRWLLNQPG
jgi:hypothetical protein